jgi:hypothetical protein
MTELLIPYTKFDTTELARAMFNLVVKNQEMLQLRFCPGVVSRYGVDIATAETNISKGQYNTKNGIMGHFAVVNAAGNVVGAASSFPKLPLRKLDLPLQPRMMVGPMKLATTEIYAGNRNITAWTEAAEEGLLTKIYQDLSDIALQSGSISQPDAPWTAEPVRSPALIHDSIEAAGLAPTIDARFDVGESGRIIPPISTLYVKRSQ